MQYFFKVITGVLLVCAAHGQPYLTAIAHTKARLSTAKEDTLKCLLLLDLARIYSSHDSADASLQASSKAKNLAYQLNYTKGIVLAISETGIVYEVDRKDYVSAILYYRQAAELAESNHLYDQVFILQSRLLNLYFYLDNFPDAMEIVTAGLHLCDSLADERRKAKYESLAGFIYLKQKKAQKSEACYALYLQDARNSGDSDMLADAHSCMSDVHILKGDYKAALEELKASRIIYEKKDRKDRLAYLYCSIGQTYLLMHNYNNALASLLKTFHYTRAGGTNQYDLAKYYLTIGKIYGALKLFNPAFHHLYTGLAIAKAIHHREDIKDGYAYLSEIFASQHRYDSAFIYSVRYSSLKDSIANENAARQVEQINTVYDLGKKNREIFLLNQQKLVDTAEISKQHIVRNILIVIVVLIATIATLLYNRYRLQQQKKMQAQLNNQRNEMFNEVIVAQDKERKRIAEDIHDSLGSVLSAAKLQLSDLETGISALTEPQAVRYRNTLQLLDEASSELRNISQHIMSATLSRLGLLAALQDMFEKISVKQGLQINFVAHDLAERLPEKIEISLYRIVLENTNNVIRHAKATQATVQLIRYANYINLVMEDNGIGFDYNKVVYETKGIGLQSIFSRVSYLGGKMHIDTKPGEGTSIVIDIPC